MESQFLKNRSINKQVGKLFYLRLIYACLMLPALAMVISSCDNAEAPLEVPTPDTHILLGPLDKSLINEPSVTFQWTGSNRLVGEFSYRCIPKRESWSEWSTDTSVTLEYLNQGNYVFEIRGRYEPGYEDEAPDQRTFTIDIPGPGMLLSPFKQNISSGEEFDVELLADEVTDMMFVHLILKFEPAQLEVLDAAAGRSFQSQPPAFFGTIDNSIGIVDVSMSTMGSEPSRLNGTGSVVIIRFRSISSGESRIYIDSRSEFRDSAGKTIDTISRIGSVIEIAEM